MIIKSDVYGFTHVYMHKVTHEWTRIIIELDGNVEQMAITSNQDGKHAPGSDHWDGRALDYRTWILLPELREKAANMLRSRLGSDYFVLLESDHLHVSYRGKTRVER